MTVIYQNPVDSHELRWVPYIWSEGVHTHVRPHQVLPGCPHHTSGAGSLISEKHENEPAQLLSLTQVQVSHPHGILRREKSSPGLYRHIKLVRCRV
jgi:hypothetical protein